MPQRVPPRRISGRSKSGEFYKAASKSTGAATAATTTSGTRCATLVEATIRGDRLRRCDRCHCQFIEYELPFFSACRSDRALCPRCALIAVRESASYYYEASRDADIARLYNEMHRQGMR